MTDTRAAALLDWLGEEDVELDDLDSPSWDECQFDLGNRSWIVLTDEEADERATEGIEQSLWAFNSYWIVNYLPDGVGEEVIQALQPQCEGANDAVRSMVGDRFEELVEDAIDADGRGHFLNTYDGRENEHEYAGETWFIYRTS